MNGEFAGMSNPYAGVGVFLVPNPRKMKRLFQFVFAAIMLFATLGLTAQECSNVQFWVYNQSDELDAIAMSYAISNAEGAVVWEGIWWEVTSEGWSEELCLAPGCYSMAIEGDQVSPETVGLELFQSDFVQILELSPADEEGVWDVWFCVEQAQEFNCPEAIGYAEGEGCTWAFEIGSFQEGEEVMWDFGDGSEPIWGGHFIEYEFEFSGTYEINAFFTSFDCPMGVELQTVVEVNGCGEADCELEMEVSTVDGMWYTFSIPDYLEDADVQWYINDQAVEGANGVVFEMGFDFNPNWWVCVDVFTEDCPNGMEACYNNLEGDCPDGSITWDAEGCEYVFNVGNGSPAEVQWSVDGEFVEWSGGAFDWTFETGGWHWVTAVYYSSTCPGETYVIEVNTDGCGEGETCELELDWMEVECDQFVLEAVGQPEEAVLFWTLDGEPYDYGSSELYFTFEGDGCHVFGVGYETPACPEGAFAEVELCSDCTGMEDCEVSLDYVELSEGIYLFSAYTSSGELYGGEVGWWTNGMNVGSGNPFAWTWDVEEPMDVNMCIAFDAWEGCQAGEACIELETPGIACEEIQLVVGGAWTATADWAFELGLEAAIDGWEIAGWSFEEDWSANGAISDTLTLCVPPACFDVFWGWDAAAVDVEALLVSVLIAGLEPIELFDWFEPFNADGFGLLPDCNEGVSVEEAVDWEGAMWPNPANSTVQFQWPASHALGDVQVFHADGRLVTTLPATQRELHVSDWPIGLYHVVCTASNQLSIRHKLLIVQ